MRFDIADASLAEEGALRIEWAARRMPVLAAIHRRFESADGRWRGCEWGPASTSPPRRRT